MDIVRIFRPSGAGPATTLGPLESAIMKILWATQGAMPVAAVVEALAAEGRSLSHSATKAVLNNLAGKGLVTKSREGKATLFEPRVGQDALNREVVSSVIGWLRSQFGPPVISQLVDELALDEASLAEFERLIQARRAKSR
jgi:predicted transcriptional regulator